MIKIFVTGGTFDKDYDEKNGRLYFKETPFFQFPLLANYSYGLENWSGTLIHTDSLPLMALIFRPFSAFLPNLFQYFGIWIY